MSCAANASTSTGANTSGRISCYERLLVHNFDLVAHDLVLTVDFAADFADLFEVRGQKRARRGRLSIERRSDASVALRYFGLDGVERVTTLDLRAGADPARRNRRAL